MQYVAIDSRNHAELTLTTADRRDWWVRIDLATLARLAGRGLKSEDDAQGVINRHMPALKLAAFRAIQRCVEGNVVRLSAADLRLPDVAV